MAALSLITTGGYATSSVSVFPRNSNLCCSQEQGVHTHLMRSREIIVWLSTETCQRQNHANSLI